MKYDKPWLSIDEQAELLICDKGLKCSRSFLCDKLREVGYYRLSAYWFPYKTKDAYGNGVFFPGTEFAPIWRTYLLDRQLRFLMFQAIGRIEVFLRSQVAYFASKEKGLFGYPEQDLRRLAREYEQARKSELFARHFDLTYGDSHSLPPYWTMVEVISMGTLESLYSHLPASVRVEIAGIFGVRVPVFKSWLSVMRAARNACCHHSRVWNRVWGVSPAIPKNWKSFAAPTNRTFAVLTILCYMLYVVDDGNVWNRQVEDLLADFNDIPKEKMGFPDGWETMGIWGELPRHILHKVIV
ncbi:MAG: Abi family protein [Raoultibacter sp.]